MPHNPLISDVPVVFSTTNSIKIRKIRLIPAAAAATAILLSADGNVIAALAAPANGPADDTNYDPPLLVKGLNLWSITGAGAVVHVYAK